MNNYFSDEARQPLLRARLIAARAGTGPTFPAFSRNGLCRPAVPARLD